MHSAQPSLETRSALLWHPPALKKCTPVYAYKKFPKSLDFGISLSQNTNMAQANVAELADSTIASAKEL